MDWVTWCYLTTFATRAAMRCKSVGGGSEAITADRPISRSRTMSRRMKMPSSGRPSSARGFLTKWGQIMVRSGPAIRISAGGVDGTWRCRSTVAAINHKPDASRKPVFMDRTPNCHTVERGRVGDGGRGGGPSARPPAVPAPLVSQTRRTAADALDVRGRGRRLGRREHRRSVRPHRIGERIGSRPPPLHRWRYVAHQPPSAGSPARTKQSLASSSLRRPADFGDPPLLGRRELALRLLLPLDGAPATDALRAIGAIVDHSLGC